uniref:Uncharacterized protein n=1 Tax=Anguilla anguilla TaxID=7936 RepID=A0A0E9S5H3_ANGAN
MIYICLSYCNLNICHILYIMKPCKHDFAII